MIEYIEQQVELLAKPEVQLHLLTAAAIFIGVYVLVWLLKFYILKYFQKLSKITKFTVDDIIFDRMQAVNGLFYFAVAAYFSTRHLDLPSLIDWPIRVLFLGVVVYEAAMLLEAFFSSVIAAQRSDSSHAPVAIRVILRAVLLAIGFILILSNLGVDVTSLVAGLGIGGIAVSLALQNILSDMFSSFSIIMDKPFEEGDFIIIGNDMGVVEKIGLKTTRVRTLQGEELVVSNNELTSTRIQNFRKLQTRRVAFNVGVVYGTKLAQLKKIPAMIEKIITDIDTVDFDRAHFYTMGDYSLQFEVVYYVKSNDYVEYMDAQQAINLGITEQFEKAGIEMAFPTQTVHVAK